ncbi:MAG TPA: hypothetical protein VFG04_03555 [Planctomycetaceae bacterium]|nr:hypothetical protein [Planctomycetaceae bacterium]
MIRSRQKKSSERSRRTWLVCAALAVVFGRGPVPWIHSHETLARHGDSEDTLSWHLQHFHPSGDDDDHRWHIHWTLPWHIVNCPCQHDNTPTEERASVLEMPFDVAQSTPIDQAESDIHASAPPPMFWTHDHGDRPPWDPLCVAGLHFLETYFPTATLRALYCVALC